MAITYLCGFEAGVVGGLWAELFYENVANWPLATGSVSRETTIVRTGTGSLKLTPASGAIGNLALGNAGSTVNTWLRYFLRVTTLPSASRQIFGGTVAANRQNVWLKPDGALEVRRSTTVLFTSSTLLTDTAKWYEIWHKLGTGGQQLWIDGVSQGSDATAGDNFAIAFGATDIVAATYTAYVDDVTADNAVNPAAGGKVVLCVPVSVAQAGTWLGGAGGAVAVAAVDFPPAGTSTETDSTQIESNDTTPDNATDEARFNMTTYTNAGIGASDTVNAAVPFLWHGEDVATGTKTGSFGMQANPADTYGTFTFGVDIGALAGFGTSGNWFVNYRVTASPSVTKSSNPVVAVRKTDTGTRVGSICAIGLYVDYTPSAAVPDWKWTPAASNTLLRM